MEMLTAFTFVFKVDGVDYKFTLNAPTQADALRALQKNLQKIMHEISGEV